MHFEPDTEWCADVGDVMESSGGGGALPCSGASVKRLSFIGAQGRALHVSVERLPLRIAQRFNAGDSFLRRTSPVRGRKNGVNQAFVRRNPDYACAASPRTIEEMHGRNAPFVPD